MNKQEVGKLLTLAALVDNRSVTTEACLMWHELVGDIGFDDAVDAMRAHYRESKDWLMPVHVRQRVRDARRAVEGRTSSERREDCREAGRLHRWLGDDTCMFCEVRAWELTGADE